MSHGCGVTSENEIPVSSEFLMSDSEQQRLTADGGSYLS